MTKELTVLRLECGKCYAQYRLELFVYGAECKVHAQQRDIQEYWISLHQLDTKCQKNDWCGEDNGHLTPCITERSFVE
jgi:hypothetical protein